MKTLLFFTSQFPFGQGEAFIESEFPFLCRAFERIIIISNNHTDVQTRHVPAHIEIIRVPYSVAASKKISAFANYFSPVIQGELNFIKKRLKLPLSKTVLSILMASFAKGIEAKNLIDKIVAQHKIDTSRLYLYSYWMNDTATGLALYRQRHPETVAICRAHGWDVYFERHQPAYLPLRKFILSEMNACFCISDNGKNYIEQLTGSSNVRLSSLGTFNPENNVAKTSTGRLALLSCSNVIPLKRIHLIIEALALTTDIEIEWTHFGTGPLEKELQQLAQNKLSALKNINYRFAGHISNQQLLHFYQTHAVDLFINVSETEGLPVSIMEATSFGIPVVATNVGGVNEIIVDGENGLLLDRNCTAADVAGAINQFYKLPASEKALMQQNAFNTWAEKYNAQKNYQAFVNSVCELSPASV